MKVVDTHCHLHFDAFNADRDDVIARAREAGVAHLVQVGTDPATNAAAKALAKRHPFMSYTFGVHPHHAHEVGEDAWLRLEDEARAEKPAALGETGLDYFKSQAEPSVQKKSFARMIRLSLDLKVPLIVHSREAFQDTYDVLRAEGGGKARGVMHCYSYDRESLDKLLAIGFLASFTCNVTYKSAGALLDVAVNIPADRIMLETDAPYLSPQEFRGKRNEPAHVAHLARFLAERRGVSADEFAEATTRNAAAFFGFGTAS